MAFENNTGFYKFQLIAEEYEKRHLVFKSDRVTWYRPTSLNELLALKNEHPTARLIVGNTEIGDNLKETQPCRILHRTDTVVKSLFQRLVFFYC